jgi:hypothetical protein
MANELLTETEAAPLLRVKVKTLQAWRQQHWGPRYTKVGRRVFYPAIELDRFIVRQMVETDEARGRGAIEESDDAFTPPRRVRRAGEARN